MIWPIINIITIFISCILAGFWPFGCGPLESRLTTQRA